MNEKTLFLLAGELEGAAGPLLSRKISEQSTARELEWGLNGET
jgi:hypothetical protein